MLVAIEIRRLLPRVTAKCTPEHVTKRASAVIARCLEVMITQPLCTTIRSLFMHWFTSLYADTTFRPAATELDIVVLNIPSSKIYHVITTSSFPPFICPSFLCVGVHISFQERLEVVCSNTGRVENEAFFN